MASEARKDEFDLSTVAGRLSYAVKSIGIAEAVRRTGMSRAQMSRIAYGQAKTTLENAAEIALASGFELKWIALGEGPQKVDQELWSETDRFIKVPQLDKSQKIYFNFSPEIFERNNTTPENCLVWVVDCPVLLEKVKKGNTVLIDTTRKKESGIVAIRLAGIVLVGELQFNLDGTARFRPQSDSSESDQHLSEELLQSLDIVGTIIWCGE